MTWHLKDVVVTPGRWEGALNQKKRWEEWPLRKVDTYYRVGNETRREDWYSNGGHAIFARPVPLEKIPGASNAHVPGGMLVPSSLFRAPRLWMNARTESYYLEYPPSLEPKSFGYFVPADSLRMVDAYLGTDWTFTCISLERENSEQLVVAGVSIVRQGKAYLAGLVAGISSLANFVLLDEDIDLSRPRWKPPRFVSPLPVEFIRDVFTPKRMTKRALREIDAYIANGLLLGDDE